MLVLHTEADLSRETKEVLRREVKNHTGEDCIVLDHGVKIELVPLKKEQSLWKRLFRRT